MYSHKKLDRSGILTFGAYFSKICDEYEFMFETLKEIYGLETFAQVEKKLLELKESHDFLSCPGSLLFEHTLPKQNAIRQSWDFGIKKLQDAGFTEKNLEYHISKMRRFDNIKEIEQHVHDTIAKLSRSNFL
jgi:hypothetical protein